MLPILFLFAVAVSSETVVVRPVEIRDVLANPGMGIQTFQRYNGDALNRGVKWSEEGPINMLSPASSRPDFPTSTVAYCRWHWAILEPEQGKVRWEIIDLALKEARRHGQRLAMRLMPYDPEHPLPEWYRNSGARRANSDASKDGKIWHPDFSDSLYFKYWSALIEEAGKRYDDIRILTAWISQRSDIGARAGVITCPNLQYSAS
jgi:Beta-galactosidase